MGGPPLHQETIVVYFLLLHAYILPGVNFSLSSRSCHRRADILPTGCSPGGAWAGEEAESRLENADARVQVRALPGDEAAGARH